MKAPAETPLLKPPPSAWLGQELPGGPLSFPVPHLTTGPPWNSASGAPRGHRSSSLLHLLAEPSVSLEDAGPSIKDVSEAEPCGKGLRTSRG